MKGSTYDLLIALRKLRAEVEYLREEMYDSKKVRSLLARKLPRIYKRVQRLRNVLDTSPESPDMQMVGILAWCFNVAGRLHAEKPKGNRDLEKAVKFLKKAIELSEWSGNVLVGMMAVNNLGAALYLMKKSDPESLKLLQDYTTKLMRLVPVQGSSDSVALFASNLNNIAEVLRAFACYKGKFDTGLAVQAVKIHRQALELRRKLGDRVFVVESLSNLGAALLSLGDALESQQVLERATLLYDHPGAEGYQIEVLSRLVRVHMFAENVGDATRVFSTLEKVCKEAGGLDSDDRRLFELAKGAISN